MQEKVIARTVDGIVLRRGTATRVVKLNKMPDAIFSVPLVGTPPPLGLGDVVALWLANYGITKAKYLGWKRWLYLKLGLPEPVGCNCGKRQAKINSLYLDIVQAYRRIRNLLGA